MNYLVRFSDKYRASVNVRHETNDGFQILCKAVARCGVSFDPSNAKRVDVNTFEDNYGNTAIIERLYNA